MSISSSFTVYQSVQTLHSTGLYDPVLEATIKAGNRGGRKGGKEKEKQKESEGKRDECYRIQKCSQMGPDKQLALLYHCPTSPRSYTMVTVCV